jgi:cytochrome c biogenesis protein CcmG, thiol:disulfide interchange protein DsbE
MEREFRPHFRLVEEGYRPGEDVYSAMGRTDAGRYLIAFFIPGEPSVKRTLPRAGLLWLLVLGLAACAEPRAAAGQGPDVGDLAPDFTLPSLDGRSVSLREHRGEVILINFWATWCPPCEREIPALQAAYDANKDKGFVILGVDIGESSQVVQPFAASHGVTYPILLDEQNRMLSQYRGLGLPMSVLIDRDGIIRQRHMGDLTQAELEGYLDPLLAEP